MGKVFDFSCSPAIDPPHMPPPILNPPIAAALDQTVLDELIIALGKNGGPILTISINSYLEDAPILMQKIDQAAAIGDTASLISAAHTLKGISASLGATFFSDLCQSLELFSADHHLDAVSEWLPKLALEYERVKAALDQERQRLKTIALNEG